MKRLLLLLSSFFISCSSASFETVSLDLMFPSMNDFLEGTVAGIEEEGSTIQITDESGQKVSIIFSGSVDKSIIHSIEQGQNLSFASFKQPDSAMESLILSDSTGIRLCFCDGIKIGNIPGVPLELKEKDSSDSFIILGSDTEKIIDTGQKVDILLNDREYTIFLFKVYSTSPGSRRVDLIILRKRE